MLVPAFAIILLFQLIGEVISRALHLPLPGPVLGMVGMVVALSAIPRLAQIVTPVAQGLLRHLSLLFVPVGVGIVANVHTIAEHWVAISVSLVVSTLLAIVVGAFTFTYVAKLVGSKPND
ncbi:MAG TPA: CidA/LrgA family protein [Paenirhodobacter sp.]